MRRTKTHQQIWLFPEPPDAALQALAADTFCFSQRHRINKGREGHITSTKAAPCTVNSTIDWHTEHFVGNTQQVTKSTYTLYQQSLMSKYQMASCIAVDEEDEEESEEEAVQGAFALNPLHPMAAQAAFLDPGFDLDELGLHELDPDDDVGLYGEEEDEMMSDDEDVPFENDDLAWDGADLGDLIHEDDYHANLHEFQVTHPWPKLGAPAWAPCLSMLVETACSNAGCQKCYISKRRPFKVALLSCTSYACSRYGHCSIPNQAPVSGNSTCICHSS